MNQHGQSRDELVRQANHVRSKLLVTVEKLDRIRHDAFDLHKQVRRHLRQLLLLGGVFVLAAAGALVLVARRVSHAADRRRRDRWVLAKRVWWHPERAMRAERRSFFGELLRSALLALLSAAVTVPAKRAAALLAGVTGPTAEGHEARANRQPAR